MTSVETGAGCAGSGGGEPDWPGETGEAVGTCVGGTDGRGVGVGEAQAATMTATMAAGASSHIAGAGRLIPRFAPPGLVNGALRLRSHGFLIVSTMLDVLAKPRIGNVMSIACRSYSALKFDGCAACVDAALDAVVQAGMYTLGRTAPSLAGQAEGPLELAYIIRVKLADELGDRIGSDEVAVEQTLSAAADDEWDESAGAEPDEDEAGEEDGGGHASMRLQDFQTLLDRLELAPMGRQGLCGTISGRLFGFDRSIGLFQIEVSPAH